MTARCCHGTIAIIIAVYKWKNNLLFPKTPPLPNENKHKRYKNQATKRFFSLKVVSVSQQITDLLLCSVIQFNPETSITTINTNERLALILPYE